MGEWQPIETAPRDKRRVLIFHAADDDGDCYKIAYWSDLAARPGWFYRGGWLEESEPEGWMPLPDPPQHKFKPMHGTKACWDCDKDMALHEIV